jgi:hypothetical protein
MGYSPYQYAQVDSKTKVKVEVGRKDAVKLESWRAAMEKEITDCL